METRFAIRQLTDELMSLIQIQLYAIELLASVSGRSCREACSIDTESLGLRVWLLVVSLEILPRTEHHLLERIVELWSSEFRDPSSVTLEDLRATRKRLLLQKSNTDKPKRFESAAESTSVLRAALDRWQKHVVDAPEWRTLPSVIPGDAPVELDDVYVDLFGIASGTAAVQLSELELETRRERLRREPNAPLVSALSMVELTLEQCLILGEPGSGKSTLVRWLTRKIAKGECRELDLAFPVRLAAFADRVATNGSLTIAEWVLQQAGLDSTQAKNCCNAFRQMASTSRRYALLLDGWDEVPPEKRESVQRAIREERESFVILITSRPYGYPRQLAFGVHTDTYIIAGLSKKAAEKLIHNLASAYSTSPTALAETILNHPNLRGMAANPFLLGLLTHVLCQMRDALVAERLTLARIYEQVTTWINESLAFDTRQLLDRDHFNSIHRLCLELLLGISNARYVFGLQMLIEHFNVEQLGLFLRSRFITRFHPTQDEYGFVHASFEEYFAARAISSLDDSQFRDLVYRAFKSESRFYILDYLAGIEVASERLSALAEEWMMVADRFGKTVVKLARLASNGCWQSPKDRRLRRRIEDLLWGIIASGDSTNPIGTAIDTYALLNLDALCERIATAESLDTYVVDCLMDRVPDALHVKCDFIRLMPGMWSDYAGLEFRGTISPSETAKWCERAEDRTLTDPERFEAIRWLGSAKAESRVPSLVQILTSTTESSTLRENTLDALGSIGGRVAIDTLVAIVLDDTVTAQLRRTAASVLRNTSASRKALDATGRDRLMINLALLPFDHPSIPFVLAALEGHPIRDGGTLIAEIACSSTLEKTTRLDAIELLKTVAFRDVIEQVVSRSLNDGDEDIVNAVVDLANSRHIPVPIEFFQQRVQSERDRIQLMHFIRRFVVALPMVKERAKATKLLLALVEQSLAQLKPDNSELTKALVLALDGLEQRGSIRFESSTIALASNILSDYANRSDHAQEGQILLAVSVFHHADKAEFGDLLFSALKTAVNASLGPRKQASVPYRIAGRIANCLVDIAPAKLLWFQPDCEPVLIALKLASTQRGWMVYGDRILDSEGFEIASTSTANSQTEILQPVAIQDLLAALDPACRDALQAYAALVSDDGGCEPTTSFAKMFKALVSIYDSVDENTYPATLRERLPQTRPTSLAAWRKCLERVKSQFEGNVQASAILRRLGLYRRP